MIAIIHGDDISASRNYYISERQKAINPVILDGGKFTLSDLMQSLEGGSLFNKEFDIFIENFFSSKKENSGFKEIVVYLDKIDSKVNILFWENSLLSKTELSVFKNNTAKLFKIPKDLFGFLDNIRPGNTDSVRQFHQLLGQTAEELIFFMIVRQFRLLLALINPDSANPIDEITRIAPWQKNKLENQAKFFGREKLLTLYGRLYKIDSSYKQGKLPTTLIQTIDFLLVDL